MSGAVKDPFERLSTALTAVRGRDYDAPALSEVASALREVVPLENWWAHLAKHVLEMPREQLERLCLTAAKRSEAFHVFGDQPHQRFNMALTDLVAPIRDEVLLGDLAVALEQAAPTLDDLKQALRTVRDQRRDVVNDTVVRFCGTTDAHIDTIAETLWAATEERSRDGILRESTKSHFGKFLWLNLTAVTPTANRLVWLEHAANGKDVGNLSTAQRVWAGSDFSEESVCGLLFAGTETRSVGSREFVEAKLGPSSRESYLARVRDLNNVLFTGTCVEVAERAATLDHTRATARHGYEPHVVPYSERPKAVFIEEGLAEPWLAAAVAKADGPLKKIETCAALVANDFGGNHPETVVGDFYVRVPVGDYGPAMSIALADTARLLIPLAKETGASARNYSEVTEQLRWSTLLKDPGLVLADGVASVATSIGLMLAHKLPAPYDTADAALQLLDRSNLVAQLSGFAPFGLLAPMAAAGYVPAHGLEIAQRNGGDDYLRFPASFEQLMHEGRTHQKQALRRRQPLLDENGATITGRGCPVAGRGPVRGADGKIELTAEAVLSILTHAMIQLTRKLLALAA